VARSLISLHEIEPADADLTYRLVLLLEAHNLWAHLVFLGILLFILPQ
jgi:hypothetical protein